MKLQQKKKEKKKIKKRIFFILINYSKKLSDHTIHRFIDNNLLFLQLQNIWICRHCQTYRVDIVQCFNLGRAICRIVNFH